MSSRVLVVDDDPALTELLVDTLSSIGYEAKDAQSATAALKLLKEESFDLVISDINMPHMSGIELLQEIKRLNRRLPVMLITGICTDTVKQQAFTNGADGFLAKPFRIGTIEREIGKLLAAVRRRRVVVIDDNEEFLSTLTQRLQEHDNEVAAFATLKQAFVHLQNHPVDLVITDLRMPDGDGLTLANWIHQHIPRIPVVMVSAYATDSLVSRFRDAGIEKFIAKPVNFDVLDEVVEHCVTI